jgi:hypothetical protein
VYKHIKHKNNNCAIFDESGQQLSDWWYDIYLEGLVDGTSSEYRICSEEGERRTLIFDRTKFIMDQLKEKMK